MIGKTTNVAPSEDATVVRVNHVMSRIMITLEAGNGFTRGVTCCSFGIGQNQRSQV